MKSYRYVTLMAILKKSLGEIERASFLTDSEKVIRVEEYMEKWGSFCVGELAESERAEFKEESKHAANEVIFWLEFPF